MELEFFVRILLAGLCGAGIGVERTRRLKEAGIRTHVIVCCAAALMMIVSKYAFSDLTTAAGAQYPGLREADPARVAAQVVSGISFLGAGVIFRNGNSVSGLTTAAGIWATAGIGLAIGAGMYVVGIFTTVVVALLQIVMHKFAIGADSLRGSRLRFTIQDSETFRTEFLDYLSRCRVQVVQSTITYGDGDTVTYDLMVKAPREITAHEWDRFLREHGRVYSVSCIPSI
jgi:putative Mg2+ transporter-C (MgtC) family protein